VKLGLAVLAEIRTKKIEIMRLARVLAKGYSKSLIGYDYIQ
jgi:hypothetical protein